MLFQWLFQLTTKQTFTLAKEIKFNCPKMKIAICKVYVLGIKRNMLLNSSGNPFLHQLCHQCSFWQVLTSHYRLTCTIREFSAYDGCKKYNKVKLKHEKWSLPDICTKVIIRVFPPRRISWQIWQINVNKRNLYNKRNLKT